MPGFGRFGFVVADAVAAWDEYHAAFANGVKVPGIVTGQRIDAVPGQPQAFGGRAQPPLHADGKLDRGRAGNLAHADRAGTASALAATGDGISEVGQHRVHGMPQVDRKIGLFRHNRRCVRTNVQQADREHQVLGFVHQCSKVGNHPRRREDRVAAVPPRGRAGMGRIPGNGYPKPAAALHPAHHADRHVLALQDRPLFDVGFDESMNREPQRPRFDPGVGGQDPRN